jgi:hypothetical protein
VRAWTIGPTAVAAIAASFLGLTAPKTTFAQAWLPGKDQGGFAISYKNLHIKYHTDLNGIKLDRGNIRTNIASADVDYGITRRWAVNVSLPYSTIKYVGGAPHVDAEHNLDDGQYHGAFQDFRFGVRHSLLRYTPVVVTPFVEAVVPSHDYVTFAHAAVGRNLKELLVGANIGWQGGDSFLSNAYFQSRISYGFVEKVLGRSHNRTNIDTEFTYFLTPRLAVSNFVSYAKHHGGLDFDSTKGTPAQQWTPEEILHHDELTRADMADVGVGAAFRLSGTTSVYASALRTVYSINAHPLNSALVIGINRRFRTRPAPQLPPDTEFVPAIPERR